MDAYRSRMCFYLKGGDRRKKKKDKYLFLNYYELEGDLKDWLDFGWALKAPRNAEDYVGLVSAFLKFILS